MLRCENAFSLQTQDLLQKRVCAPPDSSRRVKKPKKSPPKPSRWRLVPSEPAHAMPGALRPPEHLRWCRTWCSVLKQRQDFVRWWRRISTSLQGPCQPQPRPLPTSPPVWAALRRQAASNRKQQELHFQLCPRTEVRQDQSEEETADKHLMLMSAGLSYFKLLLSQGYVIYCFTAPASGFQSVISFEFKLYLYLSFCYHFFIIAIENICWKYVAAITRS